MSNFTTPAAFALVGSGHASPAFMHSPWEVLSLTALQELIWTTLVQAEEDVQHPWRLASLATCGGSGPNVRTVVLRGVTRPGFELLAFSDARTEKVRELEERPQAVWLFYDPSLRIQLRAFTEVRVHSRDSVAETYWHRLPPRSRPNYQSEAPPGTPRVDPQVAAPCVEGGAENFAVIVGKVVRLDWLSLRTDPHRRAVFVRQEMGWMGHWVVP